MVQRKSKTTRRAFVDHVLDMLDELDSVRARAMFGGHGIYVDDLMIGLIADGVFYLKGDAQSRSLFEAEGSEPFRYQRKGRSEPVAMSYWEAPVDAMESRESLCGWARIALLAAKRAPAGRKRKSR